MFTSSFLLMQKRLEKVSTEKVLYDGLVLMSGETVKVFLYSEFGIPSQIVNIFDNRE